MSKIAGEEELQSEQPEAAGGPLLVSAAAHSPQHVPSIRTCGIDSRIVAAFDRMAMQAVVSGLQQMQAALAAQEETLQQQQPN